MTRTGVACLFTMTLVFLCSAVKLEGNEKQPDWRTGKLLAVTVEGHGIRGGRRSVIWRTYCIDAGDQVYSAVSKKTAAGMNLRVNGPVRFVTAGNQLYVADSKGKRYVLKRLRREVDASRCAKSGIQ